MGMIAAATKASETAYPTVDTKEPFLAQEAAACAGGFLRTSALSAVESIQRIWGTLANNLRQCPFMVEFSNAAMPIMTKMQGILAHRPVDTSNQIGALMDIMMANSMMRGNAVPRPPHASTGL